MATYNSFRLFISEQPSVFQGKDDKKSILLGLLSEIRDRKKYEFYYKGTLHVFYYVSNPTNEIFVFQFAREERFNSYKEVDNKLQVVSDLRYPFSYLIVDFGRQIILVENKPSAFSSIDVSVMRLEAFLEREINRRAHSFFKITLSDISREVDFWREVNDADRIYSLELSFNPPNLFEGRFEADELVEEAYEATDFSLFKMKFINKYGRLKLLRDNLKDFINLISSGGGNYVVRMVKNKGKKRESRRINSRTFANQQTLPDDPTILDGKVLDDQMSIIDKLNEQVPNLIEAAPRSLLQQSEDNEGNKLSGNVEDPTKLPIRDRNEEGHTFGSNDENDSVLS